MDEKPIRSELDFRMHIAELRSRNIARVTIQFAKIDIKANGDTGVPQLHFDQLRHIHRIASHLRRMMRIMMNSMSDGTLMTVKNLIPTT
jgi:hypothetical protein